LIAYPVGILYERIKFSGSIRIYVGKWRFFKRFPACSEGFALSYVLFSLQTFVIPYDSLV
jgi:hypothetical protein